MATLRLRGDTYHVAFRYGGRRYERSTKTNDADAANYALHEIERVLYRLQTGQERIPEFADTAAYIVSGGTITTNASSSTYVLKKAIEEYLASQRNMIAASYLASQKTHLGHLQRFLNDPSIACDKISSRQLDAYLEQRLAMREPDTVIRERNTMRQFFAWLVRQKYISSSPAVQMRVIKGNSDLPPFHTVDEIERIIQRGGLSTKEVAELWKCLYLSVENIFDLFTAVRNNAKYEESFILHAIPAYTGMRRGEILRLRWLDIDLEEMYLIARSLKQSRSKRETIRKIDIHPELKQVILAWRDQRPQGQFVICDAATLQPLDKNKANRCFWQPMRRTAWCLDSKKNRFKVGFHTYRHSFISNLAAVGVDQRIIDEFAGHTTEAMRKRYRHLFPSNRRSAIEKLVFCRETRRNGPSDEKEGNQ